MQPWEQSRASRLAGPVGLALLTVSAAVALVSVGLPPGTARGLGPLSLLLLILYTWPMVLAYILGAFGLGRPLAAMLARGSSSKLWIQLGLGLGAMLWLDHALGVLGLLSGPGMRPRIVAWGVIAAGVAMLADHVVRGPLRPERWPVLPASAMLWAPGLAVLIVAAASPTGAIWSSEFGAFDALSYHLQLPKEWAAGARLWPTDHNVYSYLPSFVEAAYQHLGMLMPGAGEPVRRMLGGEGNWVIACQYLHAGMAIVTALLIGRAAWALALRGGAEAATARVLGVIAGAFTLCTPWVIVTGSLPYNENGMLAMGAAAMLIALDARIALSLPSTPFARGAAAGLAVGFACGCKPTAIFMIGPLVGLLLIGFERVGGWARLAAGGCLTGIAAIAPWLVRNWLACGNPVFPFASGLFGTGHWTLEQIARHGRNHHNPPDAPNLTLARWPVPLGEAGLRTSRIGRLFTEEFGLLHTQWGIVLVVMGIALIAALAYRRTRRAAALLALGMLAQAGCWMLLTHMQSRFLLPLLLPAALVLTLAGAGLVAWVRGGEGAREARAGRARPLVLGALAVLALAPLSQALRSATLFLEQNGGAPNQLLVLGTGVLTGMAFEDAIASAPGPERERMLENLGPAQYVNLKIRPGETPDAGVYLLGDSTPLYFLGAIGADPRPGVATSPSPVVYHTTWDTPMLDDPKIDPGARGPAERSRFLREEGIRYVLVNFSELHRLIEVDHNYDPSISFAAIVAWARSPEGRLRSVKAWRSADAPPETGAELFEIDLPAARPGPNGTMRP